MRPPPTLGEHNDEVLRIVRADRRRTRPLAAAGVIGTRPKGLVTV